MIVHDEVAARALIQKLEQFGPLGEADRATIRALPYATRTVRAGQHLVREGSTHDHCCLLIDGYACRHKMTADGGRQIVSFHLRGDIVDLPHLLLARADHNVQAITAATIACIPADRLRAAARGSPAIADALWRDVLIDASIFREWVLNVGRRDARSRIAHLICEFVTRAAAAGLGSPDRFHLPLTQEQIADATGLTPVHVNRMLQSLGQDGMIARKRRDFRILDWRRMREIAGFDDSYLHRSLAEAA